MGFLKPIWLILALVLLASIATGTENQYQSSVEDDTTDTEKKISTSLKIEDSESATTQPRIDNGTRLAVSSAEKVRSLFAGDDVPRNASGNTADDRDDDAGEEQLPEAEALRYVRPHGARRRPPSYRPQPARRPPSLNRRNVYSDSSRPVSRPPRRPTEPKRSPSEKDCVFFTNTVCLEASDYPHEAILRSLRNNKDMVSALLTDYKLQSNDGFDEKLPSPLALENRFENPYEIYESNEIKRRLDLPAGNVEEGFTCPSVVKYARPQLARAASGIWKYIINTGEHTQTLRLEKCLNSKSSCSFISENYRSSCVQVYNYHRLLTWDSKLGLHMDIFKIPSCCSCHVHGYAELYPPHVKDPPVKQHESFPGVPFATNDQDESYEESERPTSYVTKYNPGAGFDSNLVSSNKKPIVESASSRPVFTLPNRNRPKKTSSLPPRPFDKLPQQHAPNTRAPGYKGPLSSRPSRPNRPFRRESVLSADENTETVNNSSVGKRYSQPFDQETDATTRLQHGGFDDEYQEPQRRINYNYHPILDFFKPEASMLQSADTRQTANVHPAQLSSDSDSWKPMISS